MSDANDGLTEIRVPDLGDKIREAAGILADAIIYAGDCYVKGKRIQSGEHAAAEKIRLTRPSTR